MSAWLHVMWMTYFGPILAILAPLTIAILAVSALVAAIGAIAARRSFAVVLIFVSPYAWLGTVSGFIAGASQEAVVGGLLTGTLTIVAALVSYVFSKDTLAAWRGLLPFAIILLCLSAFVGLAIGRAYKGQWDKFDRGQVKWNAENEHIYLPIRKLRAQHDLCRELMTPANRVKCDELLLK